LANIVKGTATPNPRQCENPYSLMGVSATPCGVAPEQGGFHDFIYIYILQTNFNKETFVVGNGKNCVR